MNEDKQVVFIGSLYDCGASYGGAIFSKYGVCPTLMTMQGDGRQPHVIVRYDPDKTGY